MIMQIRSTNNLTCPTPVLIRVAMKHCEMLHRDAKMWQSASWTCVKSGKLIAGWNAKINMHYMLYDYKC